ncbi:MAG: NAD(+) diphosphatase [Hyphomicrobiales bacterium]
MAPDYLGFVGGKLDRSANHRNDPEWLAARRADPRAKLIKMNGDKVALAAGSIAHEPLADGVQAVFLGIDEHGTAMFAAGAAEPIEGGIDLRSIATQGLLPPPDLALLAQARSLLHWHERHRFCANCGAPTEMADAGYRRHCASCETDHFPRTDPVIIIVVTSSRGLLLGRQSSWIPGMYSALAGFMEPGETIEEAARREVEEEAGIRVGTVAYVASQPWPFPSSLMIGLLGEALSEDIRIDAKELEDARWFGADELQAMRHGVHAQGLRFPAPMAIAHHLVMAALARRDAAPPCGENR